VCRQSWPVWWSRVKFEIKSKPREKARDYGRRDEERESVCVSVHLNRQKSVDSRYITSLAMDG